MLQEQSIRQQQQSRLKVILMVAGTLLILPLIAMQFTDEVNWSAFDFLVGGILLFGAGFTLEFLLRKLPTTRSRIIGAAVLFIVLALVWAEMAVGIFGSPIAGN